MGQPVSALVLGPPTATIDASLGELPVRVLLTDNEPGGGGRHRPAEAVDTPAATGRVRAVRDREGVLDAGDLNVEATEDPAARVSKRVFRTPLKARQHERSGARHLPPTCAVLD